MNTMPMPPMPIWDTMVYGHTALPGLKGIDIQVWVVQFEANESV